MIMMIMKMAAAIPLYVYIDSSIPGVGTGVEEGEGVDCFCCTLKVLVFVDD